MHPHTTRAVARTDATSFGGQFRGAVLPRTRRLLHSGDAAHGRRAGRVNMTEPALHRGAVHEAGHAVMARWLGASLRSIKVDRDDPSAPGRIVMIWPNGRASPEDELRVAAAGRICLVEFGFEIGLDVGPTLDWDQMSNALAKMFPDDEAKQDLYQEKVDAELAEWFGQANVRSAVERLVKVLTRLGEIDGPQAQTIIDPVLASQDK